MLKFAPSGSLGTWDPGNTGSQVIVKTCDHPGNTEYRSSLVTFDTGNTEYLRLPLVHEKDK